MKLTDAQITHIFCEALLREQKKSVFQRDYFLCCYADAIRMANHKDFLILRPASLIFIAKYELGELLQVKSTEMLIHNFPGGRRSA